MVVKYTAINLWFLLGLYRIYFFPIRPEPDFAGFGIKLTVILLI